MSWKNDARKLLAMGNVYESHETSLFLARVEASQVWGGVSIDHAVSQLPASCRGQANGILRDARASGLNDLAIAEQLCHLATAPTDPMSSRDHTQAGTPSQYWDGCVYLEGMAGNPF